MDTDEALRSVLSTLADPVDHDAAWVTITRRLRHEKRRRATIGAALVVLIAAAIGLVIRSDRSEQQLHVGPGPSTTATTTTSPSPTVTLAVPSGISGTSFHLD